MQSQNELNFLRLLKQPTKSKDEVREMEEFQLLFLSELAEESKELIHDLSSVGVECKSIWDLVNTKAAYSQAIDVLINHLRKGYHDRIKEGIIRALTVKEARGKAANSLIIEYDRTPKEKENLRWVIGNAIATTMTSADVPWIFETVLDKTNGVSRGQLVLALGTVKTEQSEDILIYLLDDDEVAPQALAALGKLKSKKAREKILKMRESEDSLIRLEATKALKKIG